MHAMYLEKDVVSAGRERFIEMMQPQGEGKLVIGEWEAAVYTDIKMQEFRQTGDSFGFAIGGNPVTDQALADLRSLNRQEIDQDYIVLKD